jgi:3-oxochol-4-en-24-oyl-CoA dehydrogenase
MDRSAGLGIAEEHRELGAIARRWVERRCGREAPRATLDAKDESLPPFWDELAERGWSGLHVSAARGGEGFGLAELTVVLEQLGRGCVPGPFLPTVIAAAAIDRFAAAATGRELLSDLVSGRTVGAVGFGCPPVPARISGGGLVVDGTWETVLSGAVAGLLVLPVEVVDRDDPGTGDECWVVVCADQVTVEAHASVDRTRRVARVRAEQIAVPETHLLRCPPGLQGIEGLVAVLTAAEAVGAAAWCVETAAEHARVREQFGRPIGQFQAVKHRCADMLCALEQARAATWDAARAGDAAEVALARSVAAALAPEAAYRCAKDCVQVLGGIGFTWDHDVHLYLKRAMAMRQLLGRPERWRARVASLAGAGVRRARAVELPSDAEVHRAEVRAFLGRLHAHDKGRWDREIADAGYLVPHWPEPWGRNATAVEQLVIEEEFRRARIRRPHLAVGAWALPTIIAHSTRAQQERWIPPTLRGEITWCQLFSEPDAGSDLAALTTGATRTEGGWLLTGQKVWTTMAHVADWGICLARTAPDAPKHQGIGCFAVDMRAAGLDVRPLRELTGAQMFNEVFLTDVFVPDDCLIGGPTEGWQAARTTLGNERVSMGSGSSMGPGVEALLELVPDDPDALVVDTVGGIVATTQALAALAVRTTLRAVGGAEPGPEASVRKLLGVEHDQRVQEAGLELLGPSAATGEGPAALWVGGFLGNRSLSIAGGTSEIQRNVIAERLLGLPRDP